MAAVLFYGGKSLTTVESEQAYINASITALRAPIRGELTLEPLEPGTLILSGTLLFRVENPRLGNLEAMSQLNWIRDQMEQLRVEIAQAELQYVREKLLFEPLKILLEGELISTLEYSREEAKVLLFQEAVNRKKDRLRDAEARSREMEMRLALEKSAGVAMPFDGVVWAVKAQDASQVAAHEPVLHIIDPRQMWVEAFFHEKRAHRFMVGTRVVVRVVDGKERWEGRVESVRGGVGRIDHESLVAAPPVELSRRCIAVRVKLDSSHPFTASQFLGVGRSVVVSLLSDQPADQLADLVRK